ncbi:excinuclease ABC subunit UvrA [Candidatus Shapirobacteria bacterium]|nr:excinuclease ABC subunit UvrA [Candidatus Shapirobacteria bacterium]
MNTHKSIKIIGARENNLKNISLEIPRNQITCLVGVSGSGKSTIAYNILYSEGQRQFLESVSTYAARLLKRTQRPDVDDVTNLSPTISIDQKQLRGNPRSTVGTATEIYTYLRLLFSRFGSVPNLSAGHFSFNNPKGACPKCKGVGQEFTVDPTTIIDFEKSLAEGAVNHNNYRPGNRLYNIIGSSGKIDINKPIKDFSKDELFFLLYTPRIELSNQDQGFVQRFSHEGIITRLIKRAGDLRGISERKEKTDKPYLVQQPCSDCFGGRLKKEILQSKIREKSIGDYSNMEITKFIDEISQFKVSEAHELINRILETSKCLADVKLGYLTLNRSLDTLSGGEAQRLKLAREMGNNLIEMIYILDEPTSGLHSHDCENIINIIKNLRDKDNTIIAIEHDEKIMKIADYLVELGPKAGKSGGKIISSGNINDLINDSNSVTGRYLKNNRLLQINQNRRKPTDYLEIQNANVNNLRNINCRVPLGLLCAFTGVSGSGKSSLLIDVFANKFRDKVIVIDQKAMSGMARGNSATYIGIFDRIRDLFAKENNVSKSIFSFNSSGACPDCKGLGYKKIDMHFMGDVTVKCETCLGKRYKEETLTYKYKGKNIHEVLEMTIDESLSFFDDEIIKHRVETLVKVGLGYLELGQSHDTFSGGEAQRLKLASQLHKKGEIYILDEPTAGLHFADIEKLLNLLNELVENGNTVLVIEHNMNFIRNADWIIDLGPGGGNEGGEIVAEGTPESVAENKNSFTGQYLREII